MSLNNRNDFENPSWYQSHQIHKKMNIKTLLWFSRIDTELKCDEKAFFNWNYLFYFVFDKIILLAGDVQSQTETRKNNIQTITQHDMFINISLNTLDRYIASGGNFI